MRTLYVLLTHRLNEARRASVGLCSSWLPAQRERRSLVARTGWCHGGVDSRRVRRKSFLLIASLVTLLTFMLAACGTNSGTGASPVPTIVPGYGTSNGCPSDIVVNTAPAAPNVSVQPIDHNSVINAHVGDVIEFDLPFGVVWTGPTTSQGMLQLQTPAGYAWKATKMCVWRFVAQSAGTSQIIFTNRALCKKGQFCPQYIVKLPFTVTVK